jgi:uncharacterized protein YndB with AHSA1/START domain/DNA-binding transcriptional ArsR family regulator
VGGEVDKVFKALADSTRRGLLDSLRRENGQTLGRLCAGLSMARQSATQHLAVLEDANLISTVRRGREKLHYLNPVPIHDIHQRWTAAFEEPRLRTLHAIKRQAEDHDMTMEKPNFVYVTYIHSTPERVWHALTDADLTAAYWGHSNVSTWQPGSPWEHRRTDGSGIADAGGTIIEATPPTRLVLTFGDPPPAGPAPAADDGDGEPAPTADEGLASLVTFSIEPYHDIVRLTVTHENLSDEDLEAASAGWPAVLANLKSLLETGHTLPQAPWEMHADLRAQSMAADGPA